MSLKSAKFRMLTKISLRLVLRDRSRTASRIITVILSAFAFMLFSICSMSFTYSRPDWIVRGYQNFTSGDDHIKFVAAGFHSDVTMRTEDLQQVEACIGAPLAYEPLYAINVSGNVIRWQYFVGDRELHTAEPDLYDSTYAEQDGFGMRVLFGSEGTYASLGFSLLAGEYPDEEGEIAISAAHFDAFRRRGYVNAAPAYAWRAESEQFYYDATRDVAERETISSYDDILYKTIGMGDPELHEAAFFYTIVGVVDTMYRADRAGESHYRATSPAASWLFPQAGAELSEFRAAYCARDLVNMKKLVQLELAWKEQSWQGTTWLEGGSNFPAPYLMSTYLFDADEMDDLLIWILAGVGVVIGVFAVLLNGHLTARSLHGQARQLGILRAMGAGDRSIRAIVLAEVLLTATCIFLLALLGSLAVYYGWLSALTTPPQFGVSTLVYNGWTVLILAAFCYGVPLLCSLVPLQKFLNKTIVQNLTGSMEKPRKRKRRVLQ